MEHVDGMKYAPRLESNTGRANQRYDEDGSRMLSCIVASRSPEEGGGDVLLISSSNPKKQDWLLPKGGWDNDETIEYAAWRELMEEGGVEGSIVSPLQPFKFWKGDDGYVYHPFMMHATTVFDQWAESMRYRIWVSYDDAEKLLWKRPEMVDVVKAARSAD
ncbi:Secreted RxLR effector peptide protein [Phytophthora cinnamomi]|uniref:Secreted RxLR effector peptide protein n=1 Tax=Phytophthora cinnamomi TaxID=4785 RepID=UPI00355AC0D3|nr:Secreted RxLR effector peptide protein [Phytophthora cinnamomi]